MPSRRACRRPVVAQVAGQPGQQAADLGGEQVQVPGLIQPGVAAEPGGDMVPQPPGLQQQRQQRRAELELPGQPAHLLLVLADRGVRHL